MFRRILACLALLTLSACATAQGVSSQTEIIDRPPLNVVTKAELGDTIVEKGKVSTYDGLVLRNTVSWGDGVLIKKFTVFPGKLKARTQDANFIYFLSDNMTSGDVLLGTKPWPAGGLCIKKTDPTFLRGFMITGACTATPKPLPDVQRAKVMDVDMPSFRQELIYNGRSGDTVKFLYREFSGDYARPPFSQDVQYDLKDGTTIGFKGARIEIVEASNTQLTYRVVSSFPDPVR